LREKFSSAADERQALRIFVCPRAFTDEHELGFGVAVAKNDLGARAVQLATGAFAEIVTDLKKRFARKLVCGFE